MSLLHESIRARTAPTTPPPAMAEDLLRRAAELDEVADRIRAQAADLRQSARLEAR